MFGNNLKLMKLWGVHHNGEVVTSQKQIGYVPKYISKNSDVIDVEVNQYWKEVRDINNWYCIYQVKIIWDSILEVILKI